MYVARKCTPEPQFHNKIYGSADALSIAPFLDAMNLHEYKNVYTFRAIEN